MTSCDGLFAHLHGFTSVEEVVGQRITDLIPSVQLPPPGEHIPKVGPPTACTAWPWLGPCGRWSLYLMSIKFLDPNPWPADGGRAS